LEAPRRVAAEVIFFKAVAVYESVQGHFYYRCATQ
jgi:hypothetical protein